MPPPDDPRSLAERAAATPGILEGLCPAALEALRHDWRFWGRPAQFAPPGDWFCWAVVAGRGFGKTRLGVEWIREQIDGASPLAAKAGAPARIALIAETAADARDVLVEGESGFLACCPPDRRPRFEPSKRRLSWPNGVTATLFSAEDPDQLRGPQHHLAWGDELAKWARAQDVWSNLLFGLRLGARPRALITTTPRPITLLKELLGAPDTVVTRGTTYDNAANLPDSFFTQVIRRYEGTRLGRQELEGQILDDTPGALWTRSGLDACRTAQPAPPARIVVAIDPPATSGPQADACGIIVAALGRDGLYYVLADRTLAGASPTAWARAALEACGDFDADRLVAEVNNGGEMVETILRQIEPTVSYRAVRASHGKAARAEPVAALYEQGKVRHVAGLGALEDQMCAFSATFDRRVAGYSPDRVDALVWALTDLALSATYRPAIRRLF